MNIKEAQSCTGLKKANIRYYEQEGLLTPTRNTQNNYREYTDQDIEILNKIRFLRTLGFSIQDIRSLQSEETTLSCLLDQRVHALNNEISQLEHIRQLCKSTRLRDTDFQNMDPSVIDMNRSFFQKKGEMVMRTDKQQHTAHKLNIVQALLYVLICLTPVVNLANIYLDLPVMEPLTIIHILLVIAAVSVWIWIRRSIPRI